MTLKGTGRWIKKNPWTTAALVAVAVVVVVVLVRTLRRREGWEFSGEDQPLTDTNSNHYQFVKRKCSEGMTFTELTSDVRGWKYLAKYKEGDVWNACAAGQKQLQDANEGSSDPNVKCNRTCYVNLLKKTKPCLNKGGTKCCEKEGNKLTRCAPIDSALIRDAESQGVDKNNRVKLYTQPYYRGTQRWYVVGYYENMNNVASDKYTADTGNLKLVTIRSIVVPKGMKVTIWSGPNKTGDTLTLTSNEGNFDWDGRIIRSMEVSKA